MSCFRYLGFYQTFLSGLDVDSYGWNFGKIVQLEAKGSLPKLVLLFAGTIVWWFIRIFSVVVACLGLLMYQIVLLLFIEIIHVSKVNGNGAVNKWIWKTWHDEDVSVNDGDVIAPEINKVVIIDLIFEVCPQLIIQFLNGYILYGWTWTLLPSISLSFSVFMLATMTYHFVYYGVVEGLSFDDIPKFDMLAGSSNSDPDIPKNQYSTQRSRTFELVPRFNSVNL